MIGYMKNLIIFLGYCGHTNRSTEPWEGCEYSVFQTSEKIEFEINQRNQTADKYVWPSFVPPIHTGIQNYNIEADISNQNIRELKEY